jgi:ribonuclease HI
MPPRSIPSPSLFADTSAPAPNPQKSGWINAHCDGGARGNPGPAGYGALIQDDHGAVLAELSEFLGMRTNNYAEYSGLLGCLQYALDHHHPRLRVVSDSELMVKQIQGKYKVNSPDLKPLWQEARNRIAKLEAFEISHALRHKNKDADRLANEAMDRGMRRTPEPASTKSSHPTTPAPPPLKAIPYPGKSEVPPNPYNNADAMLRGFTKDGVVHILGGTTLPDGIFVKIIRE